METRYISLEAAKSRAVNLTLFGRDVAMVSVSQLEKIPPADVRPVVRATWEIADTYAGPGLINLRCPVCGAFGGTWKDNTIPSMLPKFCHECGADMRVGGGNE